MERPKGAEGIKLTRNGLSKSVVISMCVWTHRTTLFIDILYRSHEVSQSGAHNIKHEYLYCKYTVGWPLPIFYYALILIQRNKSSIHNNNKKLLATDLGVKFLLHIGPIGCSQNVVEHYENIALKIKGQIRAVTDFYQMRDVFFSSFLPCISTLNGDNSLFNSLTTY